MICTGYNQHISNLLLKQKVLWKCVLEDGTQVFSDFDVSDQKDPWTRLKHYCNNNNKNIIAVYAIIPGQPEQLIHSDLNGMDNILLVRGDAGNVDDLGSTVYSFITFGKLEDDGKIHVTRFFWPECVLHVKSEIREITPENEKLLYRKRESCRCQ
jgi:hypothetical protein